MKRKTRSKISLALAIMWTVCLFVDTLAAVTGDAPSWLLVFCPLTILVFDRWEHYAEDRFKEKLLDE